MFVHLMDCKGLEIVDNELRLSLKRIENRRAKLIDLLGSKSSKVVPVEEVKKFILNRLAHMFDRREGDEAFHPLSELELAFLDNQIEQYQKNGQFDVMGFDDLDSCYKVIRYNLLTKSNFIAPEEFRMASDAITDRIFDYEVSAVAEPSRIEPFNTVVIFPWRAGLAFARAALNHGFYQFAHIGVSRNEKNIKTEKEYFRYFPECVNRLYPEKNRSLKVMICDPMVAGGGTNIYVVELLKRLGFEESNITILSVISAPEGIHHILSEFAAVKIITGCHDERLNGRGYIEPGMGDYGDRWIEGQGSEDVADLRKQGILTDHAERALLAKMGFIPPSR